MLQIILVLDHYRVPTKKELDQEAQTWNTLTADGSMSSQFPKIPGPGWLNSNGYGMFYPGGAPRNYGIQLQE